MAYWQQSWQYCLWLVSNEVKNEVLHWSYRCKTIVNFLRSVIKLHCYIELVKRFKTEEIVLDRNKWIRGTMSSITEVKIFVLRIIVKKNNNCAVILQKTAYTHTHTHTHTLHLGMVHGCFALYCQSWIIATKIIWPPRPKIFTIWPFIEKPVNPWYKQTIDRNFNTFLDWIGILLHLKKMCGRRIGVMGYLQQQRMGYFLFLFFFF